MPRPAKPWYRKSRRMWTITLDGVQTPLGVTDPNAEDAAVAAWKALLNPVLTAVPRPGHAVRDVVAAYLASPDLDVSDATRERLRWSLGKFVAALGDVRADALTARQVETALPGSLSASSRHGAVGDFLGCLAWAGVQLPGKIRRPPKESRGADCVLTPAQFEVVKALATGDLRPLVVVLWETGCRPGEASALTAEGVDWSAGVARLRAHKTRRHTGRDRLIALTPAAADVLHAQRVRHGSGLLFRTTRGKPFDRQRINQRFQHIAGRAGFPVFAYMLRHSFATHALAAGVPEAHVAAVLGHTSTAMVARHYGHLGSAADILKTAAGRVAASRAG